MFSRSPVRLDGVGNFLCDHEYHKVSVASWDCREDRSIRNMQRLYPNNPSAAVDDRVPIVGSPHATCPTNVILWLRIVSDIVPQSFLVDQHHLGIYSRLREKNAAQQRAIENPGGHPSLEAVPGIASAQIRDKTIVGNKYLVAHSRHARIGKQFQDEAKTTREPLIVT